MKNGNGFTLLNELPQALSKQETERYFRLVKNGDENARTMLKEHNLRLVMYIINKSFLNVPNENHGLDKDDLMSLGIMGLLKAVDSFDIDKNIQFATYATTCIKNEILMALRKTKLEKLNVSLEEKLCEDENGNDLAFIDILRDEEDLEDSQTKLIDYAEIRKSLNLLSDIERKIAILRYGFDCDPMSHEDIGKVIGFSQSYISRIDSRIKKKLSVILSEKGVVTFAKKTEEMKKVSGMNPKEKALYYSKLIIETNITIEELAKKVNVSVFSIKRIISMILPEVDEEKYNQVLVIVEGQEQAVKQKELDAKKQQLQAKLEQKQKAAEFKKQYQGINSSGKIKANESETEELDITNESAEAKNKSLFDLFSNFSKSEVLKAINLLNDINKQIIELRYDLDTGNKKSTLGEISKQLNIKSENVNSRLGYIKRSISKQLNKQIKNSQENIVNKVETPVVEEITSAVSALKKDEEALTETNVFESNTVSEFEKYKNQIKIIISNLNNPLEQVVLLLRLGFIREQHYTEYQIGVFLNIQEDEVKNIIDTALLHITEIFSCSIECAKQYLALTNYSKNQ